MLLHQISLLDQLPALGHFHGELRLVVVVRLETLYFFDYFNAFFNAPENHVLAVEVGGPVESNEELRSVRVLTSVGHRKKIRLGVLQFEVFILKLMSPNTLPTGAIASGEVATLHHEPWNDSMELRIQEMEVSARPASALLTRAEGSEVRDGLRNHILKQFELNSCRWLIANLNVHVNTRI